jgi:glycosyltransferase involved in cell wall biosynthesis
LADDPDTTKPLRVLQIIPTLDRGGAEKQLTLLATHLPKEEFDVHVCALTRSGPYEQVLAEAGIPVHRIGKRLKWDPSSLVRLTRLVRSLKPDIVQTWIFAANCYGRVAARWAGVPTILASERCVDEWKSSYHFAIDRWLARWTKKIVVNADAIGRFYASHGLPDEKIVTIKNAIEAYPSDAENPSTGRMRLGLPAGSPVIGFIGRLWPQKRVQDLIWAADILRLSGWKAHYLIVGDGPRRASLERFARDLDIVDQVHFLGERADITEILQGIDLLVLPSAYEGLPNVVLEAMVAGKPVVACRVPGVDEVVLDGQTGLLVPAKTPLELARAIRELLEDPRRRSTMGEQGRRRAREVFSIDQMIGAYRDLYRSLVPAQS